MHKNQFDAPRPKGQGLFIVKILSGAYIIRVLKGAVLTPSKYKIYLLLFAVGLSAGILFALNKAKASDPQGETSQGEQPASVYYDESWQATEAVVSEESGYKSFDPSTRNNTPTAGKLKKTLDSWMIDLFPKMAVTKWKVHGHIHFE